VRNGVLRNQRAATADDEHFDLSKGLLGQLVMRLLARNPRDFFVAIVAAGAVTAIFVNGLFLQPGPHPAPIFAVRPRPVATSESTGAIMPALPRPRPAEAQTAVPPPARVRADIVLDIQRELTRRGFYDGVADGIYGAKTEAAIRDFETAAGLRTGTDVTEALLAAITRSPAKSAAAPRAGAPKDDAIASMLAPSPQVLAIQRALSDFGYGQLKLTGIHDADTRAEIERFERARSLPVTGQVSERLKRELAEMTGRSFD
jgi:peptidoglycan hydrolase-like protein with peptidoglycan-binding domain